MSDRIGGNLWPSPARRRWLAPLLYAILALAMFGDALLFGGGQIVSAPDTDLTMHFAASREFGFGELAQGNLPLWNTRMFSGYPYFGGFQPALLYPLNWPFVFLPLGFAINFNIALHVMLAGYFVYLWLRRQCGELPALTAGIAFMFCGRFFLHVYAGHLPHVCLVPWLAVLLMAIDGLARDGRLKWALVGAWAATMMLLAGYPQMLFYSMVVLPVYVAWRWIGSPEKLRAAGGFALMGLLSVGLCTAQLWTGAEAAAESIRQDGTSYEFAASFSFPPENLLTLFAPDAFGRLPAALGTAAVAPYFGQGYLWEMSTFIGAIATLLALVGVVSGGRQSTLPLVMALLATVLGLGANLPLHRLMYDWFPGFSSFRGSSKFLYIASLFLVQLAAIGLESILQQPKRTWPIAAAVGLAGLAIVFGVILKQSAEFGSAGRFARTLRAIADRAEVRKDLYYPRENFNEPTALRLMGKTSAGSFYVAGIWFLAGGAAIGLARWRPRAAGAAIGLLVAIESFAFARMNRPTSPLAAEIPQEWLNPLRELAAGVNRFVRNPSQYEYRGPELSRALDAWGYDPGILQRYAELMRIGQGMPRESVNWGLGFRAEAPAIFRLARISTVLESRSGTGRQPAVFRTQSSPLPRALVVPNAIVMSGEGGREAIFRILTSPSFDPANTVLLETEPPIRPGGVVLASQRPEVSLDEVDSDTRRIRVNLPAPGVLLVTESYSRHWTARGLIPAPAGQARYQVMPGNAAFIAVPLAAGAHDIMLEYRPRGWVVGRWISLGTLAIFLGLIPPAVRSRPMPVATAVDPA